MSIAIRMPALSPTMEEGTLAKWLVKVGDKVAEGTIADISVAEGTEGVKVGTVIATLAEEGEDPNSVKPAAGAAPAPAPAAAPAPAPEPVVPAKAGTAAPEEPAPVQPPAAPASAGATKSGGDRVIASPLAKRIAAEKGVSLAGLTGSGPHGRIVKADV